MDRFRTALLLTVSGLTFACGPHQEASLCDQTPAPAQCAQTCDPNATTNTCSAGFHCDSSGTCGAVCTQGGTECSNGAVCSSDGYCVDNGSGGSGDPGGPDASCPAVHFTATAITPSITLLVDQSGSMDDDFSGGQSGESKYDAMEAALVGSNGVVATLQTKAYFGATLFTTSNDNSVCPQLKATPRALSNLANVKTLITKNSPGNNTPTPQSINAAVAEFAANPPPAGSPPIIVLATDGLPNTCDGKHEATAASVTAAKASFAAGIRLFMLSVGNGVADSHAQDMANAGAGVASGAMFYKGSDPASLAAAFQSIIGGVLSCDLTINGSIDAGTAMNGTVTLDGAPLTYGTDWTLSAPTTITLLGSACDTLKSATNPTVDASFPCGSVIE